MKYLARLTATLVALIVHTCGGAAVYAQTGAILVESGGIAGSVARPKMTASGATRTERLEYGGVPLNVAYLQDVAPKVELRAGLGLIAAPTTRQIVRQGVEAGAAYHLFGSSPRLVETFGAASRTWTSPFRVSLLARTGIFRYDFADGAAATRKIGGATVEALAGMRLSFSAGKLSTIDFEGTRTVLSLPVGTERVEAQAQAVTVGWRTSW